MGVTNHLLIGMILQVVVNPTNHATANITKHLGYVVNNHGDRMSPKDRVVGPLPNGLNGL